MIQKSNSSRIHILWPAKNLTPVSIPFLFKVIKVKNHYKENPKCQKQQKKPQKRTRMMKQIDQKARHKAPENAMYLEGWRNCSHKKS